MVLRAIRRAILPATTVVGASFLMPTVRADAPRKLLRPSELPIYDDGAIEPSKSEVSVADPERSALERGIGEVRHTLCGWVSLLHDSKEKTINFVQVGVAHSKGAYDYIRDDSNILARAGLITLGGLGGLLLGARGGIFKKIVYSGGGMAAMASLCYPKEAVQISQDAFKIGKYYAYVTYNKIQGKAENKSSAKGGAAGIPEVSRLDELSEHKKEIAKKNDTNVNTSNVPIRSQFEDHGQSNPADRDMYSTRSSK